MEDRKYNSMPFSPCQTTHSEAGIISNVQSTANDTPSNMALSSQLVGNVPINLLSFLLFFLLPVLSRLLSRGRPVMSTLNTQPIHTIPAPPYILPFPLLPDWHGNLSRQLNTVYTIMIHSYTSICSWYFSWTFFSTMFPQNIRLQLTNDAAPYSRRNKPSVVINTHPLQDG